MFLADQSGMSRYSFKVARLYYVPEDEESGEGFNGNPGLRVSKKLKFGEKGKRVQVRTGGLRGGSENWSEKPVKNLEILTQYQYDGPGSRVRAPTFRVTVIVRAPVSRVSVIVQELEEYSNLEEDEMSEMKRIWESKKENNASWKKRIQKDQISCAYSIYQHLSVKPSQRVAPYRATFDPKVPSNLIPPC
ncbi:hypothetical protein GCK72_026080 [Caenorhabditis remanei]|uniref:Uncharacterized protein n=1 Tax=Caenorhabditis remanei TaxID=31234 RepID=A0A6A5G4J2_CAERE|nr:hypothetical protein GCK72_026080 [Caenorhabditis remanei]KAF1749612.1 hypothetical protein GCK72_026080 [Caenorhabditis remanei]